MTDQERGAYTPPTADAPLSFDPREHVRGDRPFPFSLILGVLVLAALVAAIFFFYQSGARQAGQAPQVVGAPVGGMRAEAPAGSQPQDPAAGLQIYRSEAGAPAEAVGDAPQFTPPPEQPVARPTTPVVIEQAPAPPASATTNAPALRPALPAARAPVERTPPPPPAPKQAPAAQLPPAKPVATVTPPAAKVEPKPAAAKAEPKPAAVQGGAAAVQIGAVSSPALAEKAWRDAIAAAPGAGAGKGKSVEKIEKNGGTLYRTAVTGFASRAAAVAFCDKLKAAGKSCFVR